MHSTRHEDQLRVADLANATRRHSDLAHGQCINVSQKTGPSTRACLHFEGSVSLVPAGHSAALCFGPSTRDLAFRKHYYCMVEWGKATLLCPIAAHSSGGCHAHALTGHKTRTASASSPRQGRSDNPATILAIRIYSLSSTTRYSTGHRTEQAHYSLTGTYRHDDTPCARTWLFQHEKWVQSVTRQGTL